MKAFLPINTNGRDANSVASGEIIEQDPTKRGIFQRHKMTAMAVSLYHRLIRYVPWGKKYTKLKLLKTWIIIGLLYPFMWSIF